MKRITAKEAAARVKDLSENHAKTIPLDDIFTKIDAAIIDGALSLEFSCWTYKIDGVKLTEIVLNLLAYGVRDAEYDVEIAYDSSDDGWKSELKISWESQFEELFAEDGENNDREEIDPDE